MKTQQNKHEAVINKQNHFTITTRRRWVTKMQFKLCQTKNSILTRNSGVMATAAQQKLSFDHPIA